MNYFKHYKLVLTNILSNFSYWVSPYICFPTFAENPIFWQIDCTHCLVGGVENLPSVKNENKSMDFRKALIALRFEFPTKLYRGDSCYSSWNGIIIIFVKDKFISKSYKLNQFCFVLQKYPAFKQFTIPK